MSESTNDSNNTSETGKAVKEDIEEINPDSIEEEVSPGDIIDNLKKEQLYLRAEFDNYKRQAIKERAQLLKYGAERLALDLLDTLDVFHSALSSEVNADNFEDFVKGIELTAQSLRSTLEKHGITEVNCLGEAFDPNTQEALSSEFTDQYPEGHVSQVFKAPYKYHDKLHRAGQVIVSRAKSE